MSLRLKFLLPLLVCNALVMAVAGLVFDVVQRRAFEQEARSSAELMHGFAEACREHAVKMANAGSKAPDPTWPSTLTRTALRIAQKQLPTFTFRQPALSPLNPENVPTDLERAMIAGFRSDLTCTEKSGYADLGQGVLYYVARPSRVTGACLQCHGRPEDAPAKLREVYGTSSGFGWQVGDTVGMTLVGVPLDAMEATHGPLLWTLLAAFGILAVLIVAVSWIVFERLVDRRIRRMARAMEAIAAGPGTSTLVDDHSNDALGVMAIAFNSMAAKLRESHGSLERRVTERTAELTQLTRDREQVELSVRQLIESTASTTGPEFFDRLVTELTTVLGVRYAMVGEVVDAENGVVRVLSMHDGEELMQDFEYGLEGTPCENVVGKTLCVYPERVQELFPTDAILADWGIQSYAGTPLFDAEGNATGILAILDVAPITNQEVITTVLNVFGVRAASELQRCHTIAELRRARREAEQAATARSSFLANMSHEIRTPMTAILGFSDLLLDPEATPADKTNAIVTIRRNGRHLLNLINDILDLSRIEAGKMPISRHRTELLPIVHDTVDLLAERARSKAIALDLEFAGPIPEQIETDPIRLKQALVNLVGNAVKFTAEGQVKLIVACNPAARTLTLDVSDTGIGMTAEELHRVFEPFVQADASATRSFTGSGLGLAITRQIAMALGGSLTAASEAGCGSTFRLVIPVGELSDVEMLSPERARHRARSAEDGEPHRQRLAGRILLVEDGEDNQRLVRFLLEKAGAAVQIAEHGESGLRQALEAWQRGAAFDLILMDMQMPVMDGYTATRALRQYGYEGPILALTADAMKGDDAKCIEAGCDGFLSKPISRRDLLETVAQHLTDDFTPTTDAGGGAQRGG